MRIALRFRSPSLCARCARMVALQSTWRNAERVGEGVCSLEGGDAACGRGVRPREVPSTARCQPSQELALWMGYTELQVRSQMRSTEAILEAIHARGCRVTGPRRAIVEFVLAQREPFSAEEVFRALRRRQPTIGRATVFRTLDLLTELGVVERVHHPSGVHRYVVADDEHRHHVVCIRCGRVAAFSGCNLEPILSSIAAQTQFQILDHWLELSGLCEACQAATAEVAGPSERSSPDVSS